MKFIATFFIVLVACCCFSSIFQALGFMPAYAPYNWSSCITTTVETNKNTDPYGVKRDEINYPEVNVTDKSGRESFFITDVDDKPLTKSADLPFGGNN